MPTIGLAAIMYEPGTPLSVEPVQVEDPQHGEVLVRTTRAAVCGTDVHFATGRYSYPLPAVLGHEATGIVEAVGPDVISVQQGDMVIVCDRYPCGRCGPCATGDMAYCADKAGSIRQTRRLRSEYGPLRQYLGISAFAEHMLLDENAIIAAPAGLTADTAALLSCGITTGIASIVNNDRPPAGGTVAVIGCGAVGLGAVIGARLSGASAIFASDPLAHRLQAGAALGATLVINAADTDPCEEILQASRGGVDRAVEAVGLPATAIQALRVLRRGGHATVLGMMPNGAEIPLPARLLQEGRSIGGAVMGRARIHADIPRYARLAADGHLDLSGLVSTRRPLGEINAALADASDQRGIRHLIEF